METPHRSTGISLDLGSYTALHCFNVFAHAALPADLAVACMRSSFMRTRGMPEPCLRICLRRLAPRALVHPELQQLPSCNLTHPYFLTMTQMVGETFRHTKQRARVVQQHQKSTTLLQP